jgi:hypothetical protein
MMGLSRSKSDYKNDKATNHSTQELQKTNPLQLHPLFLSSKELLYTQLLILR